MDSVADILAQCEAHVDKNIDFSPVTDKEILQETQTLIGKLEGAMANQSLKASEKSAAHYLLAGLNLLKETPAPDTEANLLKSVG